MSKILMNEEINHKFDVGLKEYNRCCTVLYDAIRN